MCYRNRYLGATFGAVLACALAFPTIDVLASEKERINPPGIFKHPNFTRVITVKGTGKMIFIAGQTPSDMDYKCVAPGDFRGQQAARDANAYSDRYVSRCPSPSRSPRRIRGDGLSGSGGVI